MGFCTDEEYHRFFRQCPAFERMLIDDGIILVKYWFSVSDEEQERRFKDRLNDPLKRWKLSDMDLEGRKRWVQYSKAKDEMFAHCDLPDSPWYEVEADDKKKARLNCIAHLLSMIPTSSVSSPSPSWPSGPQSAITGDRPAIDTATFRTTRPPSTDLEPGSAPYSENHGTRGEYEPSPSEWVRDQVAEYESSGGQRANTLMDTGLPIIIVTTAATRAGRSQDTGHEGRT